MGGGKDRLMESDGGKTVDSSVRYKVDAESVHQFSRSCFHAFRFFSNSCCDVTTLVRNSTRLRAS
jgi:hypothetical protein